MAIDLSNNINLVTTPSEVVNFDQNTPTTSGVVFTPNTPLTQDVLYVSSTNASTWIYDGEDYITYSVTPTATTPFYIQDTTIDAGGNKTAPIQHNGYIKAYGFYGSGAGINFLNANYLAAGTVPTARLGSGTADSTTYLRGDGSWVSLSVSVPQANKIYVDSINGVNSTGRGRIDAPYLTIQYALSQISNTGTVTASTTNTSADIIVSSASSIKVGQYIVGTNIPLHSIVVAISGTTITLSKPATGTGTGLTMTYYTPHTIVTSGDFAIVDSSNLLKAGVSYELGDSTLSFVSTLLTTNANLTVPFYMNGGHLLGRVSTARLLQNSYTNVSDIYITPKSFFSNGTSDAITSSNTLGRNFILRCLDFNSNLGNLGSINITGKCFIDGNFYGLLGGFALGTSNLSGKYFVNGLIETPLSVTAINHGYYGSTSLFFNGQIIGQLSSIGSTTFSGVATGTSHTITSNHGSIRTIINGDLNGNVTLSGGATRPVEFNGATANGGTFTNTGSYAIIQALYGPYSASGSSIGVVVSGSQNSWSSFFGTITLAGTSQLTIGKNPKLDGYITYGQVPVITVGSGCKLVIEEFAYGMLFNSGEVVVNGVFDHEINQYQGSIAINTGILTIKGTFNLNRNGGTESSTNTPTYAISTGTIVVDGGKVYCNKADSKSGLFRKTANGGNIILKSNAYLKVSNGLAPLQILSNTGTAQDILDFSVITNGAVGFRIADTFSDTTYGTAYAPNLLVGGDKKESTTYTW